MRSRPHGPARSRDGDQVGGGPECDALDGATELVKLLNATRRWLKHSELAEAGPEDDLAVFVDENRIKHLEEHMKAQGYLEASRMATAFNMLRSNDLVWPYIVNNYLRGKKPYPFDILYWNSDATRMPAANHSFYLRNCYLENRLAN